MRTAGTRETGVKRYAKLINAGRKAGSIPSGPPARAVALALLGALEGAVIALAGHAPHDELLAAYAVAGVLGIDSHRATETPYLRAIPTAQVTPAAGKRREAVRI